LAAGLGSVFVADDEADPPSELVDDESLLFVSDDVLGLELSLLLLPLSPERPLPPEGRLSVL
jgi:hypothetical protein